MFDQQALSALGISLIAGLSTMLGTVVILLGEGRNEKLLTASLGFAAGVCLLYTSRLLVRLYEVLNDLGTVHLDTCKNDLHVF